MQLALKQSYIFAAPKVKWVEEMAACQVNQYTFHIEASKNITQTCRKIREAGMGVGIALKPGTPVEAVKQYVDIADMILIMTVEPGFGGQKFMQDMMPKVQWLREHYPSLDIEVDGGVGPTTIHACAEAGANMIVSGTATIGAPDPAKVIKVMRDAVTSVIDKR